MAGETLPGGHRVKACELAGITDPDTMEVTIKSADSEMAYVASLNLLRRHLTPGQKAAAASRLLPAFEVEAKERQRKSGGAVVAIVPQPDGRKARDDAAKAMGVSPRYVSDAKKLMEESPEEFAAVERGEKSLPEAKRADSVRAILPEQELRRARDDAAEAIEHWHFPAILPGSLPTLRKSFLGVRRGTRRRRHWG